MTPSSPARRVALIYAPAMAKHSYGDSHPMKPVRLQHFLNLAQAAGFLDAPGVSMSEPRPATQAELLLGHEQVYIDAVREISGGRADVSTELQFGFGPGDNPSYPGMFEAHALGTGASVVAADLIREGRCDVAFNPAGGLHHALPARASGFCIFNDPVIAIRRLVEKGMRVAYVDIDCHHGDGVQYAFYDTARVMTISLHESGRFLFPGTGDVSETGTGSGAGYSVNVPLAPYTDDETYAYAFDAVVPPLVRRFQPDALFTQLGIDTHVGDPITHLRLTTQGFAATVARLGELAGESGRWIASGGGGYNLGAVARGWAMAFAAMAGADVPADLPAAYSGPDSGGTFADPPEPLLDPEVQRQVRAFAERSVEGVRELVFPFFGL